MGVVRSTNHSIALLILTAYALLLAACTPQSQEAPQLRIANVGAIDIDNLTLVFPGRTPTDGVRVAFGDVPAGSVSGYQLVPGGVYRYAAYEYTLERQGVQQPVVDWLGERPLTGTAFTYRIRLDTTRVIGDQITLVDVVTDTP
jgi:hypothetical protein